MISVLSENCVLISPAEKLLSVKTTAQLKNFLEEKRIVGWIEAVPTFSTLSVYFNPFEVNITSQEFLKRLQSQIEIFYSVSVQREDNQKLVEIPVCYNFSVGVDLPQALQFLKIGQDEFIKHHTQSVYEVGMLGFLPGFPYMQEVSEFIRLPRKEQASQEILPGMVGIAGKQTGIYPVKSPGGWCIVGRTPLKIFDKEKDFPFLLKSGDQVKFYPISKQEYDSLNQHEV